MKSFKTSHISITTIRHTHHTLMRASCVLDDLGLAEAAEKTRDAASELEVETREHRKQAIERK